MTHEATVLCLLGGFLLTVGDVRRDVPARKVKALVCRLAFDDAPLPRDQLSAVLWPDSSQAAARHSLRQALTELRRSLAHSAIGITVTAREAALETYGGRIDVREFRHLAASADPAHWAAAMELYRGSLLEGLTVRVDTFDEWLDGARRELGETAVRLCRALADHHDDDVERAIGWTRRLLALDPLDEAAHRDLMRLYIRAGQDGAAIRQYLHCRSVLERELGIGPDAETVALYEGLLTHRASSAAPVPAAAGTAPDDGAEAEADPSAADAAGPDAPAAAGPAAETPPAAADVPSGSRPRLRPAVVLCCCLAMPESDPERADALRRRQLDRLGRVVRSYGGRLVAELGSQVIAGFGLGRVRGTEADRACLAGAELAEALPGLRGGIASGQVIFRPDAASLVGQAAAEAQDLAARAAPGEVLVSAAVQTARRYVGAAQSPDGPGGREAGSAPLVGRALEIRQFVAVLDGSRDGGYGCTLLLRGEPGIGKSRLVREYAALAVREGFAVHVAQAYDFAAARGQDAIAQLLRSLLGGRTDTTAIAAWVGEEHVPVLQVILGIDPPRNLAERLDSLSPQERLRVSSRAVRALVRACARENALVLVVDDLHWADRLTLAMLPPLAQAAAELPVVLVLTSRVAGEALDPEWRASMGGTPLVTVDLRPLPPAEATRLASALGAAESRLAGVLARAGGNPLFIEQLVRSGCSERDLPHSIQSLAVAQLDALPERVQAHVRAASVLGQSCSAAALEQMVGEPPALEPAVEAGLMAADAEEWHFRHALIRDGIYQNVLASERRVLHERAAAWYRERSPILHARHLDLADAPGAVAALVAAAADELEHYRLSRARQLALRALERAPAEPGAMLIRAELDLVLGDTAAAADGFRACLGAAAPDAVRARALVGLGMALNQLDQYPAAAEALRAAVEFDRADHAHQADAWLQLGNVLFPQGLANDCLQAHRASLEHAVKAGSTLRQARAEGGLGDAYYQQGAMLTAFRHFDRCVRLGEANGHAGVVPPNLAMRGLTLTYQNRFRDALADEHRALELAEQSSNLRHVLLAHNVLGVTYAFQGDFEAGIRHAARCVELGERIGARRFVVDGLCQLAHLHWAAGRLDEARNILARVERLLDPALVAFAGAYVRGLGALCAESAAERRACLEGGERLLNDRAVSHCHLYFHFAAIEACLIAGDRAGALRYAAGLETYTRREPLPFADFFIRRARALTGAAEDGERERVELIRLAEAAELGAGLRLLQ